MWPKQIGGCTDSGGICRLIGFNGVEFVSIGGAVDIIGSFVGSRIVGSKQSGSGTGRWVCEAGYEGCLGLTALTGRS
ncbi:hypothetical protein [Mycolicibacterium sphagni]|uniref:Uncharacterized protein n=1 Tax=Mycolicibacterium sphagni TaxID=1786 RepID=A0ABX2KAN6_9MYCO|nr:hypothetical protein [Mycolicibacterium sphagni]NTY64051.1 hypothetical protein [Mycolicibacterium sphagni]